MIFARLLFLIFSFCSYNAFAGKILFLDMNKATNELAAAKQAASLTGDTLVIIPSDEAMYSSDELKKALSANAFKSIVISGHSGGPTFTGKNINGSVSVEELLWSIKESGQKSVEALYLMGCYTGTKSKVALWKNSLPELKFIAGFNGQAPLNSSLSGSSFLKDCILKENQIIRTTNEADLFKTLDHINNARTLDSAIYVNCGESLEYYYLSQSPAKGRMNKFDVKDCGEKLGAFKENVLPTVRKYWNGELEPTFENTQVGFLRKAYAEARQFEYCLDPDVDDFIKEMDPNSLLLLLFNKDFNRNFAEFYKKDFQDLYDDIVLSEQDSNRYKDKVLSDFKKRSDRLSSIFEDPVNVKAIQSEIVLIQNEMSQLRASDPTLEECYLWSRNCHSTKITLNRFKRLSRTLDSLKSPASELISRSGLNHNSYEKLEIDPAIKSILKKMVSESDKITRQDILDLNKAMEKAKGISLPMRKLQYNVYDAADLSDEFPFSWHEYKKDEQIEPYNRSYIEPKNPVVNEVLNLIE